MEIKIPVPIMKALDILEANGKEAFIVGGCVRDAVMGKEPNDWDITTNALPEETKEAFSAFRTVDTGIKHGTVLVIIDGEPVEITTYRVDGEYSDNRHPDSVAFTPDIENDLARRDFTVNAMAYSPKRGLVDVFGGRGDIGNGILRCVGDADRRFNEDALRIMRALRFSSTLGFSIEEKTSAAIHSNASLLDNIARERISTELLKLLSGANVFDILMNYRDVIGVCIPELKAEFDFCQYGMKHAYTVWGHTCHTVENIENEGLLRLIMLLHDCGKPSTHKLDENGNSTFKNHARVGGDIARKILTELRMSKNTVNTVSFMVGIHDMKVPGSRLAVKKYLNLMGKERFLMLMKIRKADRSGLAEGFRDISDKLEFALGEYESIIANGEPYNLSMLAVNGTHLAKRGITGEKTKEVLDMLLEKVMENPEMNDKKTLLSLV